MLLVLALILQLGLPGSDDLPIGLPDPDAPIVVGGEIEGPYIFREDVGQTTKVILKNGLTVIVRESNAIPLTAISTQVHVGYADEGDRLSGISRLVETMLFSSAREREVGEIAKATRTLGGSLDSHTEYDRTVYETVVPADNAVAAMELQAAALWNPRFDREALAQASEFVIQEDGARFDDPGERVRDRLYGTAFAGSGMRQRIDSPDALRALTVADLGEFHSRYYRPSNVVLVLVGRFNRETMLDEVVRIYGDAVGEAPGDVAPGGDATDTAAGEAGDTPLGPEPPAPDASQDGFRYDWERGRLDTAQVAIGYHVPGAEDDSTAYALEVLSAILTGGRASRMNWFLRDEQGLVDDVESRYVSFPGRGYFSIRVEAPDLDSAETAVFEELDRVRRFGIRGEGLERAKVWVARNYYERLETVSGIADNLAREEANGDWKKTLFFLEGIRAVTAEELVRVVSRYFVRENLSVFEYLPSSSARAMSSADFARAILDRLPVNIVQRSIEELDVPAEVRLLEQDLVIDVIPPQKRFSILRGPDIYIAEDRRLPLVSFGIFYTGGRLFETAENAGITELMLRSSLRGTRRYNTSDIARRLENDGARVEVVNEPDFHGYILEGVSGQIADALSVLMEVLQEPTFLEEEVESEKRLQLAAVRRSRDGIRTHPVDLFMATLFDDDPYARPGVGFEESVRELTAESLADWHREHQKTVMPVIVIAGDTEGTALVSSIAETLTNEDLFEQDTSALGFPSAPLDAEESVFPADWSQSVLVRGTMVAPYAHSDRLGLEVIRHVLSGGGGRLSSAIREDEGLAGAVHVDGAFYSRAGALFAYATFSPENEEAVRGSVIEATERLIRDGITDEDLEEAIAVAVGALETERQKRRGKVLDLARAVISGGDPSAAASHEEDLRQVDAETVRSAAERYLSASQAKTVVVRGGP